MPRPWIVHPHDAIEKHEPELWSVLGEMGGAAGIRRRMFIARFPDGRLAFFNAVPLREEAMRELEAFGAPAFLCVPAAYHTLDVVPFKARYPQLRVLANPGVRERLAKKIAVDGGTEEMPRGGPVRVEALRGTAGEVAVAAGGTLCFPGDALMNIPHFGGPAGFFFRLVGSTGGPRVTNIAKLFVVRDRKALAGHLRELAAAPGLKRIVPCHGRRIEERAADTLRAVADGLG
ncbi:MAG TPA: hypothetical protein VMK66_05360 [Myxococcales bacterium]|nr:hypothetical protein [Myxococcales bacterium]